jgi:hypothetical protein
LAGNLVHFNIALLIFNHIVVKWTNAIGDQEGKQT